MSCVHLEKAVYSSLPCHVAHKNIPYYMAGCVEVFSTLNVGAPNQKHVRRINL